MEAEPKGAPPRGGSARQAEQGGQEDKRDMPAPTADGSRNSLATPNAPAAPPARARRSRDLHKGRDGRARKYGQCPSCRIGYRVRKRIGERYARADYTYQFICSRRAEHGCMYLLRLDSDPADNPDLHKRAVGVRAQGALHGSNEDPDDGENNVGNERVDGEEEEEVMDDDDNTVDNELVDNEEEVVDDDVAGRFQAPGHAGMHIPHNQTGFPLPGYARGMGNSPDEDRFRVPGYGMRRRMPQGESDSGISGHGLRIPPDESNLRISDRGMRTSQDETGFPVPDHSRGMRNPQSRTISDAAVDTDRGRPRQQLSCPNCHKGRLVRRFEESYGEQRTVLVCGASWSDTEGRMIEGCRFEIEVDDESSQPPMPELPPRLHHGRDMPNHGTRGYPNPNSSDTQSHGSSDAQPFNPGSGSRPGLHSGSELHGRETRQPLLADSAVAGRRMTHGLEAREPFIPDSEIQDPRVARNPLASDPYGPGPGVREPSESGPSARGSTIHGSNSRDPNAASFMQRSRGAIPPGSATPGRSTIVHGHGVPAQHSNGTRLNQPTSSAKGQAAKPKWKIIVDLTDDDDNDDGGGGGGNGDDRIAAIRRRRLAELRAARLQQRRGRRTAAARMPPRSPAIISSPVGRDAAIVIGDDDDADKRTDTDDDAHKEKMSCGEEDRGQGGEEGRAKEDGQGRTNQHKTSTDNKLGLDTHNDLGDINSDAEREVLETADRAAEGLHRDDVVGEESE